MAGTSGRLRLRQPFVPTDVTRPYLDQHLCHNGYPSPAINCTGTTVTTTRCFYLKMVQGWPATLPVLSKC